MSTDAQITANRENATKSTGPKTEAGKAASSRNATRHGFYSREFQVRDDEKEEFNQLYTRLYLEVGPNTTILTELFYQLVHATWNLHRIRRIEAGYFLQSVNPYADAKLAAQLETIARHRTRFERVKTAVFKQIQDQLTNLAIARESGSVPLSAPAFANLAFLHKAFKRTGDDEPCLPSIDSVLATLGKKPQIQAA